MNWRTEHFILSFLYKLYLRVIKQVIREKFSFIKKLGKNAEGITEIE